VQARGAAEDAELAAIRAEFAALMIKQSTACGAWREIELDGTEPRETPILPLEDLLYGRGRASERARAGLARRDQRDDGSHRRERVPQRCPH
jgi:hypothetical protein